MKDVIDWLQSRPYAGDQIVATRTEPGSPPTFADCDLEDRLAAVLESRGIERLYRHQVDAIEAVRAGRNVVLATPTASGKSLAYTVPAFERAMDHGGRTLYLGPQNALINDQESKLQVLARDGTMFGSGVSVRRYTGQLADSDRTDVRNDMPTVLLSNPDMLHYGILPHAYRLWEWFLSGLELVVVDEVHEYRGVFGSHVALVLRRLARLCERFDADPQFVCCSATIGNPREHAAAVTGQPEDSFALVDTDHSGTGPTNWVFWNPPEHSGGSGRRRSNHVETMRLLADLVAGVDGLDSHQTVAFTSARQTAERYAEETAAHLRSRGETALSNEIAAYQAALTTERREELEAKLFSGELRGVWSTTALELGVDVGGLDAVLLDGYPGTRMAARQQAGRAGRGMDPSLVVLVAGEDQLDQYLMAHPDDFFEAPAEEAVVNPENEHILPGHVRAAARENWLSPEDDRYFGEGFADAVGRLTDAGDLDRRETDRGLRWTWTGDGSPAHEVALRSISDREIDLFDRGAGERIASLPFEDALRDAHEGAIYHHQGTTYEVVDLDLTRNRAELQRLWQADHYTKVLHDKTITVEADREERPVPNADVTLRFADVTMRQQITGYQRKNAKTGEVIGEHPLDLPETSLETSGLYFTVPDPIASAIREEHGEYAFNGGIHAAEHALISLFPLHVLCDRRDVGGVSTPMHPHTGKSTIFIYDGHPGGVGLARAGYDRLEALARRARRLIADCDCADGCPACVQSPHCGNANDPLSKPHAVTVLDTVLDEYDQDG